MVPICDNARNLKILGKKTVHVITIRNLKELIFGYYISHFRSSNNFYLSIYLAGFLFIEGWRK